jgi:hypothetical protein
MIDGSKREFMQMKDVRSFLDSVLDEDIHTRAGCEWKKGMKEAPFC